MGDLVPKRRRTLLFVGAGLLGPIVIGCLIVGALFDGYRIPSSAMSPTLNPDDRVLARSASGDDVARGDVIIYLAPERPGVQPFVRIARVVAVAGDEVGEDDEFLTINGQRAEEPYLPIGTTTFGIEPVEVPEDHVFVMGDNRGNSQDSRSFGPVPNENVRGLVVVQWWPIGNLGGF